MKEQIRICAIPTKWRNVDNYCHWTFTELPLIYLPFSGAATNIVLPDALLNAKLTFQIRWYEVIKKYSPEKKSYMLQASGFPQIFLFQ
jgi:hypothetical protein